jgi:hypothetical protein
MKMAVKPLVPESDLIWGSLDELGSGLESANLVAQLSFFTPRARTTGLANRQQRMTKSGQWKVSTQDLTLLARPPMATRGQVLS